MEEENSNTGPKRNDSLIAQTFFSSIGNVLEWFDFAIYAYFAPEISTLFFPKNSSAALLETFAIFGGAFLMRPIGGVIVGRIGDIYGRKRALFLSITSMALATFSMGLIPNYSSIGVAAPILLTVSRLVQGLSVGGQLVGTYLYIVESAPPNKRCFYGSLTLGFANLGTVTGSAVGAIIHAATSPAQLLSWGWRIPFLCGIFVGFAGYMIETKLADSAEFEVLKLQRGGNDEVSPIREAWRENWQKILLVACISCIW